MRKINTLCLEEPKWVEDNVETIIVKDMNINEHLRMYIGMHEERLDY